ncbi:MAG: hypothetical protein HY313_09155 [Acidobacteria bacterium]|nr:hypothetical protein [Acidobacteriota bacterium]
MIEQHKANGGALAMSGRQPVTSDENPSPLHLQRHFHVRELAELWGVSPNTARRWFEKEPDVLRISLGYRRGKDHKVCLRIPESVAERVHRRRCRLDV